MARRKVKTRGDDDIDAMLRQVSRPHARALAEILFGVTEPMPEPTWIETQVAARQRRVDRALASKIGDELRWQHIEWTERLDRNVYLRIYEYNHLLVMAALADAESAIDGEMRLPATVDSVVVVLTGPKQGLPSIGFYRTSSPAEEFSGVHFRIEPIYLRTVAELEAMNGVFWLVFTPLALDADEPAIVRAIDLMYARTNRRDFADLVATMFTIARLKKDRPSYLNVIRSHERRLMMLTNNWLIQGRREGRKEGRKEGELLEQKRAQKKQRDLLLKMVERRLRRSLATSEQATFDSLLSRADGADKIANAIVDLSPDELARLFANP